MNVMKIGSTFYFSRLLGNRVYGSSGEVVGRFKDFVVDASAVRPRVIAVRIQRGKDSRFVTFESVSIEKVSEQYRIECTDLSPLEYRVDNYRTDNTFMLAKHVLDKQLIDLDGRKLVRVNDIRLATLSAGTYVVAVDVGFEGLLRRLGIAKPAKTVLKPFQMAIPSNLLLWDEIETIDFGHRGIRLSKDSSRLATMHPSDLADILEDLDIKAQLDVFSSLDEDTKLDVLEELESDAQVSVVEQLSVEAAAAILEKLPSDEAADILDEMHDDKASKILGAMQPESSGAIQALLQYGEDTVGSVMTTDHFAFNESVTAERVIETLRRVRPEADRIYYLYVVNDAHRLIGTVSLRDLIIANPSDRIRSFTNENIVFVLDTDDTDELLDVVHKYNLLAVPVVNQDQSLVGVVTVNDVIDNLKRTRRGRF
ncbi:magnesium transporter [Alicyclobacillus mengziensis]|uniref:Magnesium transporter n=1 Tax=Alicyclobacillus mengziensis TaxID=2931921 RepID=A0A9X7W159_9BACL|nr:CBS domain-containing protein [Alicyclobacillus mengziensis]QSO48868.1 magnesium transporter [Alicyclobacillus mengziensis]